MNSKTHEPCRFVAENRPGAGGSIATEAVMRAVPDGATLGFAAPSLAIAQHVTGNLPYDPRADLDGDNTVNVSDYNLLKSNFGSGGSPPLLPGSK